MIRQRVLAVLGTVAATVAAGLVAMPLAHADPLEDIKGAVGSVRLLSGCGFLNYNRDLEGNAQALIRNTNAGVPPAGNYKGKTAESEAQNDPTERAIDDLIDQNRGLIRNCAYKDFGVGMRRGYDGSYSVVSLVLGEPAVAPAAPPPPPPPVQCPPDSVSPTVPAGQQCQAKPKVLVNCPPGSPTPQVEQGQKCADVPAQTDKIQASFGRPGLSSVDFTVTNASTLNAACDYIATTNSVNPFVKKETTRTINVPAGQSTTTSFDGAPTLSTYNVTLTCKDASGQQKAPIGTVTTSLTW